MSVRRSSRCVRGSSGRCGGRRGCSWDGRASRPFDKMQYMTILNRMLFQSVSILQDPTFVNKPLLNLRNS
jgi:hypothetical protein